MVLFFGVLHAVEVKYFIKLPHNTPETIAARAQLPQDTQPSAEEEKQDES